MSNINGWMDLPWWGKILAVVVWGIIAVAALATFMIVIVLAFKVAFFILSLLGITTR